MRRQVVSSHRAFFPLFDSLRGIAAMRVVMFHLKATHAESTTSAPFLGRLDVGVTIFFLISGFLLYRPSWPLASPRVAGGDRAVSRGPACCGSSPATGSR